MRLLFLNPNTSTSLTDRMASAVRPYLAPTTELVPATAARGFPYISSRAEADVSASIVLEMIAEHEGDVDAVVVAAFGDPGLYSARELYDIPIVGVAEAAILTACAVGDRFGIVTFSQVMSTWYLDSVSRARLDARFTGVRVPSQPAPPSGIDTVQETLGDQLVELVDTAVTTDKADVVIIGGAPLAGFAATVEDRVAVPVIDPVVAGVLYAEMLVRLGLSAPLKGAYARPPAKPSIGLPPALARRIGGPIDRLS
ncbi:Asp/Glu/hydantoin racemase [Acuticoccus sediminis]|uniref:Asp/Glu/hydantoin racemase n=1 Tax=Acuticoccus sediminis TaxID=2184697 RepID=A0A8B2NX38_9HYPH|nr:aspartate/glutamate racemase family protein [Acuticoccus sediminis]RAI03411.1 Asp/Glu/hydantoin racemase [Acuticoccus sediminis]